MWNAQVRIAGWRSFTKTFEKKSDALDWCRKIETKAEGKYKGRAPKARDKKVDIQRMTAEGMKPKAISEALGISASAVLLNERTNEQIKKLIKKGGV